MPFPIVPTNILQILKKHQHISISNQLNLIKISGEST